MAMAAHAVILALITATLLVSQSHGQGLIPGIMLFGDSVVDAGNNNNLPTLVRANFPPYGRDFSSSHSPTGRFCNGKLATDFTVENLGLPSYPPPYLSQEAQGKALLHGANFASAASGYLNMTANLYGAIPLAQQVLYYREYQSKVTAVAGKSQAAALFRDSVYILSTGSSDYVQNYYVNSVLRSAYTPDQFSDALIRSFGSFVESLYGMGARRIGVTTLPPFGCLPASITLFGSSAGAGCVTGLNDDAAAFNKKLRAASQSQKSRHPDLKLVVFDIYNPLLNIIKNPGDSGFFEARRACCGTGTIETSLMCNAGSPGTCSNATGYVFWDSFHPSEAANRVLAESLLAQGIELIS